MEFVIKSNRSDRELVFSNMERSGDLQHDGHFQVELRGSGVRAKTRVYVYRGADGLNDRFQDLGAVDKPWSGVDAWKSLEGEFSMTFTCDNWGHVRFGIEMRIDHYADNPEEAHVSAGLTLDLGALPLIAKSAQKFFEKE